MKFNQYPKILRVMFIAGLVTSVIAMFAVSIVMKYYMPDDPMTDLVMQWRFVFILVYIAVGVFMYYSIGVFGGYYVFSDAGIKYHKMFTDILIPWEAVKKIGVNYSAMLYITIEIKNDYNDEPALRSKKEFTLEKSQDALYEIGEYWEKPIITE